MYAVGSKFIDKLITPLLLVAVASLATTAFSAPAAAVSLDELYDHDDHPWLRNGRR